MFKNISKNGVFVLLALALSGVIHQQAMAQQAERKTSISVIAAGNPTWYSVKNKYMAQAGAHPIEGGLSIDTRRASQELTRKMQAANFPLGAELTKAVVDEFKKIGFEASVVEGLRRYPDDFDSVDYAQVKTNADVVLHIYFSDVGTETSAGNGKFLPKVNVTGYVFNPRGNLYIHEETVYYGVGSREGQSWGVQGDPKFAYGSFEELIQKLPEVTEGFNSGAQAAGRRLANNIAQQLR